MQYDVMSYDRLGGNPDDGRWQLFSMFRLSASETCHNEEVMLFGF